MSWFVKIVFRRQGHTDPVPGHLTVPNEGLREAQTHGTGVIIMWAGGMSAYSPCWTMRANRRAENVYVDM